MLSSRWTLKTLFHPAPKPHPPNCCCAPCKAVRGLHVHVEGKNTDDDRGVW